MVGIWRRWCCRPGVGTARCWVPPRTRFFKRFHGKSFRRCYPNPWETLKRFKNLNVLYFRRFPQTSQAACSYELWSWPNDSFLFTMFFLVEASMTGSSKRASLGPWCAKWKWVHSFLTMKMFAFKQTDAGCTHIHKHDLQTFQQLFLRRMSGWSPRPCVFLVWFDCFDWGSESLLPSRGTRENWWHGFYGTTSTAKVWATCCWQQHVAPSKCKAWRYSAWLSMH